jgi:hypothetical protein
MLIENDEESQLDATESLDPLDALRTALDALETHMAQGADREPQLAFHAVLSAVEALKRADRWEESLEDAVADRILALQEAHDFSVKRASHWTNSNYTRLIDPLSATFQGERLGEAQIATEYGHGLARTLRLTASRRWDRKLDAKDAEVLAQNPALAQLQGLEIAEQKMGPAGIATLMSSPHLSSLRALSITGCKSGSGGAAAIARNPALSQLEILILSQGRIENSGAEALARSPHLTNLRVLVLDENGLGAAGLRAIAQSATLQGLTYLSINSNKNIGWAGVAAFAESPYLRSLETLNMYNVKMGAKGAKALANSPVLATLKAWQYDTLSPTARAALLASPHLPEGLLS